MRICAAAGKNKTTCLNSSLIHKQTNSYPQLVDIVSRKGQSDVKLSGFRSPLAALRCVQETKKENSKWKYDYFKWGSKDFTQLVLAGKCWSRMWVCASGLVCFSQREEPVSAKLLKWTTYPTSSALKWDRQMEGGVQDWMGGELEFSIGWSQRHVILVNG